MPEKKVVSKSVAKRLAIQKASKTVISESPAEDLLMLRKMIWLNHGCGTTYLYGDDGEMQCNRCLIDFKRDSVVSIYSTFEKIGVAKMAKATEADIKTIGLQHRAENAKKEKNTL